MLCLDEAVTESESDPAPPGVPAAVVAAAERARAEARQIASDRRTSARIPQSMLTWLQVARLKFGQQVGVVDLSAGGALIESSTPLGPGTVHALELAGGTRPVVAKFGVVRSKVASITAGRIVYRTACAFTEPLDLPELKVDLTSHHTAPVAVPEPVAAAPAAPAPAAIEPFVQEIPAPEPAAADWVAVSLDAESTAAPLDRTAVVPVGWHRIVARYLDGRAAKGFTNDFAVTRPQFTVRPTPDAAAEAATVDVPQLKAVFFVRDFDGDPTHRERQVFGANGPGRRLEVRFTDGEVVLGTTPGYRPGGPGFFMTPADSRSNNSRIFIVSAAVRNVRFL